MDLVNVAREDNQKGDESCLERVCTTTLRSQSTNFRVAHVALRTFPFSPSVLLDPQRIEDHKLDLLTVTEGNEKQPRKV
jgi:hypothetical protein